MQPTSGRDYCTSTVCLSLHSKHTLTCVQLHTWFNNAVGIGFICQCYKVYNSSSISSCNLISCSDLAILWLFPATDFHFLSHSPWIPIPEEYTMPQTSLWPVCCVYISTRVCVRTLVFQSKLSWMSYGNVCKLCRTALTPRV